MLYRGYEELLGFKSLHQYAKMFKLSVRIAGTIPIIVYLTPGFLSYLFIHAFVHIS